MTPLSSARRVASIATFLLLAWGLAYASQAGSANRRVLLFIDDLHLQFRDTPRTYRVIERLLSAALRNGSTVAIVTTGASSVSIAPTQEPEVLQPAARRITGNALRPREVLDAGQQPQILTELRRRAGIAEETAVSAIRVMSNTTPTGSGLDVVYISDGYIEGTAGEMRALVAAAVAAMAAIHSIDVRDFVPDAPARHGITQDEWDRYLAVTRQSLRYLSLSTGGAIVVNDGDLAQVLDRLGAPQP